MSLNKTSESIDNLSTDVDEEEDEICVICLDPVLTGMRQEEEEEVCILQTCMHIFHSKCIQCALINTKSCPVCRQEDVTCQHGIDGHCANTLRAENHMLREALDTSRKDKQEFDDSLIAHMLERQERQDRQVHNPVMQRRRILRMSDYAMFVPYTQ
jgi:hypothetical protein